jgi:hypothetical protein
MWKDNIKMDVQQLGMRHGMADRDTWRALVNALMNFRFPYGTGNFLTGWGTASFSSRSLLRAVS